MLTFDFPKSVYERFIYEVPERQRARITDALSRQPFKITLGDEGPVVTVVGEIGDKVFTNENESYRPFVRGGACGGFRGENGGGRGETQ